MALMSKLDGINRHSFNAFRLRVGEALQAPSSPASWEGFWRAPTFRPQQLAHHGHDSL